MIIHLAVAAIAAPLRGVRLIRLAGAADAGEYASLICAAISAAVVVLGWHVPQLHEAANMRLIAYPWTNRLQFLSPVREDVRDHELRRLSAAMSRNARDYALLPLTEIASF